MSKRVASAKTKTYLIDEDKLKNYVRISKSDWSGIPIKSHIRYQSLDGQFRTGGFVERHGEKDGRKYIVIRPGITEDVKTFVLFLDKVKFIWKKIEAQIANEFTEIQKKIMLMDAFHVYKFGEEYKNFVRQYSANE